MTIGGKSVFWLTATKDVDEGLKHCYHRLGMERKKPSWKTRIKDEALRFMRWFTPGLGVKRWLVLVLLGTSLIGAGLAILVLDIYRNAPETWWLPALSWISLRFLARPLRALIFGGLGLGLILAGIFGLNRSILAPFVQPGRRLVDTLTIYRRRGRGPRIVVIGGGHGLATLLRGLKAGLVGSSVNSFSRDLPVYEAKLKQQVVFVTGWLEKAGVDVLNQSRARSEPVARVDVALMRWLPSEHHAA